MKKSKLEKRYEQLEKDYKVMEKRLQNIQMLSEIKTDTIRKLYKRVGELESEKELDFEIYDVDEHSAEDMIAVAGDIVVKLQKLGYPLSAITEKIIDDNIIEDEVDEIAKEMMEILNALFNYGKENNSSNNKGEK